MFRIYQLIQGLDEIDVNRFSYKFSTVFLRDNYFRNNTDKPTTFSGKNNRI